MVNGGEFFVSCVVGLATPLALLDGFRSLARPSTGFLEDDRGALAWLLAVILGPGLFVERMLAGWREGLLDRADAINAVVIAVGWATLYGYVVLEVVWRIVPS